MCLCNSKVVVSSIYIYIYIYTGECIIQKGENHYLYHDTQTQLHLVI